MARLAGLKTRDVGEQILIEGWTISGKRKKLAYSLDIAKLSKEEARERLLALEDARVKGNKA